MENLIKEFLEHADKEHLDKDLYYWLSTNGSLREKIFREVEKEYRRIDVIDEFEIREIENYTDDDVEYVLYHYEEYLGEDESWHIALDCAFEHLEED